MMRSNKKIPSITIIGAGNVGHHMAIAFHQQGIPITQIYSRKKRNAQKLAKLVQAIGVNDLKEISAGQDLYIIAVNDDAIEPVAVTMSQHIQKDALVVHTSGACPSILLKKHFRHFGVFYPLQSFSKDKPVNWRTIPLCIHAKYKRDLSKLDHLAQLLSKQVLRVDDEQRAQLHLAAVFVNNFTNFCYEIGNNILQAKDLPFEILLPLIQQTIDKINAQPEGQKNPSLLQTGPAIRRDQDTINQHLNRLNQQFPQYRELYMEMTKGIQSSKSKNKK